MQAVIHEISGRRSQKHEKEPQGLRKSEKSEQVEAILFGVTKRTED